MSDFLQTSPESGFVRTRACTVALPDGRLRLRELVLTERHGDEVSERELAGEQEWRTACWSGSACVCDLVDVAEEREVELPPGRPPVVRA